MIVGLFIITRIYNLFFTIAFLIELHKWLKYLLVVVLIALLISASSAFILLDQGIKDLIKYIFYLWFLTEAFYSIINPILRFIPSVIGAIVTRFISVPIGVLLSIIIFITIEIVGISLIISICYVSYTDLIFNPTIRLTYLVATFSILVYSVLIGTGGYISFVSSKLFGNNRYVKKSTSVFFITVVLFISIIFASKATSIVFERNDMMGYLNRKSDIDVRSVISNLTDIEQEFLDELALTSSDIERIKNEPPRLLEFASCIDTTLHKKYFIRFYELAKGNFDYVEESISDFKTDEDTSEVSILLHHQSLLITLQFLNSASIPADIQENIVNSYLYLRNTNYSTLILEKERIKLLIEFFPYLHFLEKGDFEDLRLDLEKGITKIYDQGYLALGFYCSSRLAEIYLDMLEFHKAEKTLMHSNYLLSSSPYDFSYTEIEYDYFMQAFKRAKLVLGASISVQRPGLYALEILQKELNGFEDEFEKGYVSFIEYINQYRAYYEIAISEVSSLVKTQTAGNEEIQIFILQLIERNKARMFKKRVDVDWITHYPKIEDNQIGLNYIIGFNSILGQIYTSDSTYSFSSYLSEIEQIWAGMKTQIINNVHPDSVVTQILTELLIPSMYHDKFKGKELIVSVDGIISELPFQYLLKEMDINSIKYVPSFSFLFDNKKNTNRVKNKIGAISVSNPTYIENLSSNDFSVNKREGLMEKLEFADLEVERIHDIAGEFNNSDCVMRVDATEEWIKDTINQFNVIHFSGHSMPYISKVQEGGLLAIESGDDDGIYSESEIREGDFSNSIIFLSSCDTNAGEYYLGEGYLSIAHAFLSAGADGVISSLWPIDDKATTTIVEHFYLKYFDSNDAALSLFEAQREMSMNNPTLSPAQTYPFVYIEN